MKHFFLFLVLALAPAFDRGMEAQTSEPPSPPSASKSKPAPTPASVKAPTPPRALAADVKALPPTPVVTDELTAYLYPPDDRKESRDLQLEWDELELVTLRNTARQLEITAKLRKIAMHIVDDKKIDLKLFELDSKELKFVKKKAQ